MASDTWDMAVTEHVKNQIRAVAFSDRDYINELVALEGVILRNGPRQFHQAMQYHNLRKKHPADVNLIKEEINRLRTSDPERLRQLQEQKQQLEAEHDERAQAFKEARTALNEAIKEQELELWLEMGGRPDR